MLTEGTPPVEAHARGLDRTTVLSCTTKSWACPGGNIVELRVAGEIDRLTCPDLCAAVDAALDGAVDPTSGHLVVDLSAVTFCCVRGFALFADTGRVTAANGVGYALSGLSPHLERHARMLWADGPGAVRLTARRSHDVVLITVADDGRRRAATGEPHRGRGLRLIRLLVQNVHLTHTPTGTVMYLRTALSPAGTAAPAP